MRLDDLQGAPLSAAVETETQKKEDPFSLDEMPLKPKDPARNDYIVGAILSGAGFLVAVAGAIWILVNVPPLTECGSGPTPWR